MGNRAVEFEGARWLVLLLQGVRRSDLGPEDAPELHRHVLHHAPTSLEVPAGGSVVDRFFAALPLTDLRDRGLCLDRRSYFARPTWQSDRCVVDQAFRRPRGSADSVVLWLRDAGRAATLGGTGSAFHRQAIRDLDAQVSRVLQRMRRGEESPNVLAVAFDPLVDIDRSFDLPRVLDRELPRGLSSRLRIQVELSHARIRCASMRDLAATAERIMDEPFVHHGNLVSPRDLDALDFARRYDELVFVPHPYVALAPTRVHAAPRFVTADDPTTQSTVTLPWRHHVGEGARAAMTIESVASQFAERVCLQLRPRRATEQTDVAASVQDYPDLLAILDPDVAKILGSLV